MDIHYIGKILEALQLLKDGISFSSVAEKFSEDKAKQGGSLGWLARGNMVGAFQGTNGKISLLFFNYYCRGRFQSPRKYSKCTNLYGSSDKDQIWLPHYNGRRSQMTSE